MKNQILQIIKSVPINCSLIERRHRLSCKLQELVDHKKLHNFLVKIEGSEGIYYQEFKYTKIEHVPDFLTLRKVKLERILHE
jgi:hypothetical protein